MARSPGISSGSRRVNPLHDRDRHSDHVPAGRGKPLPSLPEIGLLTAAKFMILLYTILIFFSSSIEVWEGVERNVALLRFCTTIHDWLCHIGRHDDWLSANRQRTRLAPVAWRHPSLAELYAPGGCAFGCFYGLRARSAGTWIKWATRRAVFHGKRMRGCRHIP